MNHVAAPRFQVDKYVALPAPRRSALSPRLAIYPWAHMQPGDSFFVPRGATANTDKRDGVKTQINTAGAKKKYPGTAWTVRAVTENGVNGVRVWRVK